MGLCHYGLRWSQRKLPDVYGKSKKQAAHRIWRPIGGHGNTGVYQPGISSCAGWDKSPFLWILPERVKTAIELNNYCNGKETRNSRITILNNPLHIFLIAVPLVLQTVLIFFVAYGWAKWWKLPHDIAAPAGMIGASNFFELAVAVAISLFGLQSGAALATVVGVLVEVPVMLTLVRIANNTRSWFPVTEEQQGKIS